MKIRALFLDFYGTVVEEDDQYIQYICKTIATNSCLNPSPKEVSRYWWQSFTTLCHQCYGAHFKLQREIEVISLQNTIQHFKSTTNAKEMSQLLFNYWEKPDLFPDAHLFFDKVRIPVYIVSNIDRIDLEKALSHYSFQVNGIITSQDAHSYKPRSEIFETALQLGGLKADEVLHIGDSWSSDIEGADGVGIESVWVNRKDRPVSGKAKPLKVCQDLVETLDYLYS
jgi:2-haloacid dehalogenase/putative hydrolase of the HAD superfamily